MAHFLNNDAMRLVERNERGTVTFRKRYRRGDEVDTSHMDDARVEALVNSGALVTSKDDVRKSGRPPGAYPGSRLAGAALSVGEDHSDIDDPGASPEENGEDDDEDGDDDEDESDGEDVDQYSAMDYGQLQDAARTAGISANQSADNLRAALREHDAA